jgi:hypothetical protein
VGRVPYSGPAESYKGVILMSPGGPGSDGLSFLGWFAEDSSLLTNGYDLVAFDPRRGGAETGGEPLGCVTVLSFLNAVLDAYDGSTSLASLASLTALIDSERACLDACAGVEPRALRAAPTRVDPEHERSLPGLCARGSSFTGPARRAPRCAASFA